MRRSNFLKAIFSVLTVTHLATFTGCGSTISEVANERQSSNVPTTEANGIVTAKVSPSSTADQIAVASQTSKVADSAFVFAPGSLAIETDIALGEAVDQSAAIVAESGITAVIAKSSAPFFVAPAMGDVPTLAHPGSLILPLPLSDGGLTLTGASGKLVFIYAVFTTDGWKSGIKPLTASNLVGTFLRTPVTGLGYFQVAYLATAVEEKEVTSAVRPALQSK